AGSLTPPVATEGAAFSNVVVFHFTDADPAGTAPDYTAVVAPGDGNSVTLTTTPDVNGQVLANAGVGFDVLLSYTYAEGLHAGNVQVVATTGGGFDVVLSYTYAEELSNPTFSVSVTDHASTASASTTTSRLAAAPISAGSLTPPVATEGAAFSNVVVFHFTD